MENRQGKRFVASYSGGKDSVLALHRALKEGMILQALIITYNTDRGRSWFHGIPEHVLEKVERSVGAPVKLIRTSGERYSEAFEEELKRQRQAGAEICVFGDIDLEAHLEWGRERCSKAGLEPYFPLWQESREKLVYETIEAGFQPVITVVNTKWMDISFLGEILTKECAARIEESGADICGENGEYHTFVKGGPVFLHEIDAAFGAPIQEGEYGILPML